jgi:dGTPase
MIPTKQDRRLDEIRKLLDGRETRILSPSATRSDSAHRRTSEERLEKGYRQAFSIDVDRILHSRAYMRYIDKTQVFYLIQNDHITHRVLHVQLVSKIARTIGRFLGQNEDLIEAISLGHDIGHAPFGHDGESFLSEICRKLKIGHFLHNVQSVQFLDRVEQKGKGWNLTLQTLDGILCHDGEIHEQKLKPEGHKTFETLQKNIIEKKENPALSLIPMSMEGCVVRMADTIGYIGRDIDDAVRLKLIRRSDIPKTCAAQLGTSNGDIVYALVTDLISNSYGRDWISFSPDIAQALKELREFNYERIYMNPAIKTHTEAIGKLFEILFERYMEDLEKENHSSVIYSQFLEDMSEEYTVSHRKEEIVRDFIAGMTDHFFLRQCPEKLRPV